MSLNDILPHIFNTTEREIKCRQHTKSRYDYVLRFMLVMVILIPCKLKAQDTYKVKVQKLNVRTQPNTSSAIAGSLTNGTEVKVNSIKNGWAAINFNGKECYVNASFLEKTSSTSQQLRKNNSTNLVPSQQLRKNNSTNWVPSQQLSRISTKRQAKWRFDASGWAHKGLGEYDDSSVPSFSLMLGGDIPITLAGQPLTLETGLRYLNRQQCVSIDGDVFWNANYLEVPARLAYEKPLSDNWALRMGAGPYLSYLMNEGGGLNVGIEPAVSLRYKNFSVGLQYSVPVFKGYDYEASNIPMINLSIRFGNSTWKGIGNTLLAIGDISQTILDSGILDRYTRDYFDGSMDSGSGLAGKSDMIEINSLISYLSNQIMPMRQKVRDIERNKEKTREIYNRPKEQYISHGQIKERISRSNLEEAQKYFYDNTDYKSAKHVVDQWDRKIAYLRKLQAQGKTHISKEQWENYNGKINDADKKWLSRMHENTMKQGYRDSEKNARDYYNNPEIFNESNLRFIRDNMRKFRESSKDGIKKSKYEQWLDDILK